MPIKKAFKTSAASGSNPRDPRTATFTTTGKVAAYEPVPQPIAAQPRGVLLRATLDRDLNYFFNVAEGTTIPDNNNGEPPTLVLNLFRATDPTKKPVAERMILGQAQGAPYYALHASSSTTSVDEFNALQITRRAPLTGNHVPACTAEIQPRLDLFAEGTTVVANITSGSNKYHLVRTGTDLAGGSFYAMWADAQPSGCLAQYVIDEGWKGLDAKRAMGIIRVRHFLNLRGFLLTDDLLGQTAYSARTRQICRTTLDSTRPGIHRLHKRAPTVCLSKQYGPYVDGYCGHWFLYCCDFRD